MALAPDKIELAQQIADVLEEKINAVNRLYGSTFTKSDCCRILIRPLLGKYQVGTLLESLPLHVAEPVRKKHSKLMACFDSSGELLDQNLSLKTIKRYVSNLIKELRSIGQGDKQKTTAAKRKKRSPKNPPKKTMPIKDRFTFEPGQVLFDDCDVNIGTGAALEIIEALVNNFGHVVLFQKLDDNSSTKEASEKLRTATG